MTKEIFTICDNAQAYGDKLVIVGPFTRINATTLPMIYPGFSIVARLRYQAGEMGKKHITIRIVDPDGRNLVGPFGADFELQSIKDDIGILNFNISIGQLQFDRAGEYAVLLEGDGMSEKLNFFVGLIPSGSNIVPGSTQAAD